MEHAILEEGAEGLIEGLVDDTPPSAQRGPAQDDIGQDTLPRPPELCLILDRTGSEGNQVAVQAAAIKGKTAVQAAVKALQNYRASPDKKANAAAVREQMRNLEHLIDLELSCQL